ncbi:MAG: formate acetyltransferase, partial [Gammaproteobacteria bacterium]|nr:formate acetyltransferase [Gammaproteobacteria bacterium]
MQNVQMGKAWRGFSGTVWQREIDVRDFIVANVTPFAGRPDFLAPLTARTQAVWERLQPLFREEIKKGVLDVDPATPASLTAFGPGYIDRDNEVIVGLQTDKPFKRAIMPTGGFRMVEAGLKAAGFEVDPTVREIF